eukprot:scaffold2036_cov115-Isochrysis_galbana.AAC.2
MGENSRKSQLGRYWEDFLSSRRSSAGIAKISGACACLASGRLVGTLYHLYAPSIRQQSTQRVPPFWGTNGHQDLYYAVVPRARCYNLEACVVLNGLRPTRRPQWHNGSLTLDCSRTSILARLAAPSTWKSFSLAPLML